MAVIGTSPEKNVKCRGGYYGYYFSVSVDLKGQDIRRNTSDVVIYYYARSYDDGGYNGTWNTPRANITVNGSSWLSNGTWTNNNIPTGGSKVTIGTRRNTAVQHNDDGTLTLSISASYTSGTTTAYLPEDNTVTYSIALPTIARNSAWSAPASADMTSAIDIVVARSSSSATVAVAYQLNTESSSTWHAIPVTSTSGLVSTYHWTVPDNSSTVPDQPSATYKLRCITTIGSTALTPDYKDLIATIPNYSIAISSWSFRNLIKNSAVTNKKYIQNGSRLKITAITATTGAAIYNASLSTVRLYMDPVNATNHGTLLGSVRYSNRTSLTTDYLPSSGNHTIRVVVTDSRGKTGYTETSITVAEYTPPQLIGYSVVRCDSSGNVNPLGTCALVKVSWSATSINTSTTSTASNNTVSIRATLSSTNANLSNQAVTGSNVTIPKSSSVTAYTFGTGLSSSTQYTIKLQLWDTVRGTVNNTTNDQPVVQTLKLSSAKVPISLYDDKRGNVGVGFGTIIGGTGYQFRNYDVTIGDGMNLRFKASSSNANDPGDIIFQNSSGTEVGRIWKDASSNRFLLRYSSSDGGKRIATMDLVYPVGSLFFSTTITSPEDVRTTLGVGAWERFGEGRVILGQGTGTDSNSTAQTFTAGATGGEYTHTLSGSEMPSHRHWGIEYYGNSGWNVGDNSGLGGTQTVANGKRFTGTYGNSTSMSKWVTALEGGGGAHNNMPPYVAVYIYRRTS